MNVEPGLAISLDRLSPEDVEKATFSISERGFDRDEVEVFLHLVAEDIRALLQEMASASIRTDRPYEALGKDIGVLMQRARDAADQLTKSAQIQAATRVQEAEKKSRHLHDEATRIKREAQTEASGILEEAGVEADRLRYQAEHARRLADAEASIRNQDIRRSVKKITDDARHKAQQLIAKAEKEAAEREREGERRVRRLQEAEQVLRRRLQALTAELDKRGGGLVDD